MSVQQQPKPIVLCHSRDINTVEKIALYKFLNVLEFNHELHNGKVLQFMPADLVTIDLRSSKNRNYLAQHIMEYKPSDKALVWVRDPGDVLPESDTFKFSSEIKRFNIDAQTKDELLSSLKQVHIPKVEGRVKRVLKKLLSCLFKLA